MEPPVPEQPHQNSVFSAEQLSLYHFKTLTDQVSTMAEPQPLKRRYCS